MQTRYIPEDRFPMQVSPAVQVIGNYYFNLMLITGKEKPLLFEAGVSGMCGSVDQVINLCIVTHINSFSINANYHKINHAQRQLLF